jgi:hypothetical protein
MIDKIINYVYNYSMEIKTDPITIQYYIDRQRYLAQLTENRRQDDLRSRELDLRKDHIERINRARELQKDLGQNIDVYV